LITFFAISRAFTLSPELYAGCPQQDCIKGTVTLHPAFSKSFAVAKPTEGLVRSTKQVANKPMDKELETFFDINRQWAQHTPKARRESSGSNKFLYSYKIGFFGISMKYLPGCFICPATIPALKP